ncbi:MAG: DNA translocase FtsK 4TM domain-containing protein [Muribaculaceae bacterium]|nr:DNA translocase FtsK 4TM domain-containing protein [Muribaculaceae bacterium]
MTSSNDIYNHAIDYDPDNVEQPADNDSAPKRKGSSKGKRKSKQPTEPAESPAEKQPREWPTFIRFFLDKRTHAVTGIGLILLAAYIAIASLSYFSTAASDQSKLNSLSVEEMIRQGVTVENIAGPMGATTAHMLMTHGLGIGSLVLVVYLIILGLTLIGSKKNTHFWSLTLKCLVTAIGASMIAGIIDLYMNLESVFPYGGVHGRFINLWLIARIEWVGAVCVSLFLAALLTYIYINDLLKFSSRVIAGYRKARPAMVHAVENAAEAQNDEIAGTDTGTDHSAYMPHEENVAAEHETDPEMLPVNVYFDDESLTHENVLEVENNADETDNAGLSHTPVGETDEVSTTDNVEENNDEEDKQSNLEVKGEVISVSPDFDINVTKIEEGQEDTSELYDPTAELSRYERPPLDLLIARESKGNTVDRDEQDRNKERITKTLKDYGIPISKIQATVGPTVTLYEIIPAEGVRIAKIKRLEDDIALSLAALGIRIIAPIPGKGTIGIEVPNKDPETVSMRQVIGSKAFQECKYQLPMAMGATISNDIYIADLAKMPHLLVAGATGQGKSVGLNAIIASLLYKKHPSELKFVLVDPKMVEFSLYSKLQYHFMAQLEGEEDSVITDTEKVERTLNSLCVEMDNRYNLLKEANVRSIIEYNEKFAEHRLNPEKGHRYLPYIVIIVDEFADLIMTSGKAIETPIARIAQKARAVGMHMIIATQRPSTNVITGIIKANFPGRIAFRVSQMVDSKTILDRTGANQLIGRGDMLFSHNGSMERVQCAFIDTPEVQSLVDYISGQIGFDHPYYLPEPPAPDSEISLGSISDRDPLFEDAARFLCAGGDTASTSSLQRKFSIGYNRAGKIMDQLESAGIVSAAQGSKPRNVLVDLYQLDSML